MPFFLIFTITGIARVIQHFVTIPVDEVVFIDDRGERIDTVHANFRLEEIGHTLDLSERILVLPLIATNQDVVFTSVGNSITITPDGYVTAIAYGLSQVTVRTISNNRTRTIDVLVHGYFVRGLQINPNAGFDNENHRIMTRGETIPLQDHITVIPHTAENQNLQFSTSDPNVATVGGNGMLFARYEGEAVITVRSVQQPHIYKTLHITVVMGMLEWDFPQHDFDFERQRLYVWERFLPLHVFIHDDIYNPNAIVTFSTNQPSIFARIVDGNVLEIMEGSQGLIIVVTARYFGSDNEFHTTTFTVIWRH